MEKSFLYEIVISGVIKIIDTPAAEAVVNAEGVEVSPATAEVSHLEYKDRLDQKNVVATDVPNALSKLTLEEGQFFGSAARMSEVYI